MHDRLFEYITVQLHQKKILRSSRIRVDLLSYKSNQIDKREQNDWMAEKKLDGKGLIKLHISVFSFARFYYCNESYVFLVTFNLFSFGYEDYVRTMLCLSLPVQIFLFTQLFCSRLSIGLLSYNSRLTLI